jgi:hypothetical protein
MEAVLKQEKRISPRRFQQQPRAIGGRLLPKSWRARTRLAGLLEAISKHLAGSSVIRQRTRQQTAFLTTTSERIGHLPKVGNYA